MRALFFLFVGLTAIASASRFELLMGKGTPSWEEVRTVEDRALFAFYERLSIQNQPDTTLSTDSTIPATLHTIWLGPAPLPQNSLKRMEAWHALYPDWEIECWTDLKEMPKLPWLHIRSLDDFPLEFAEEAYCRADNAKEKAFYLMLEILYREGGIALEHDVSAQLSFAKNHRSLDFFCPLAPLRPSIFSSSVFLDPYVLGARAGHPFLKEALLWVRQNSKKWGLYFPGSTPEATIVRTRQRIYEALHTGAREGLGKKGSCDEVFAPSEMGAYFTHLHQGAWKRMETVKETALRKKIEGFEGRVHTTFVLCIVLAALLPITSILLIRRRT